MKRLIIVFVLLIFINPIKAQISKPDSIFTIKLEGSDELNPTWSADGNKIVFQSNKYGNWDIFLYDFIKDTLVRLTFDSLDQQHPVFFPKTNNIIVFDEKNGNEFTLKKLNVNTGEIQDLIKKRNINGKEASFSPSGRLVTFKGFDRETGKFQIYSYDFIYDNLNRLTGFKHKNVFSPEFSPDGKIILFGIKDKNYPYTEHLAEITWYGDSIITIDSLHSGDFCWSPDGYRFICQEYETNAQHHLISERKDGTSKFLLLKTGNKIASPSMSPKDLTIAISVKYSDDYDIVIMRFDE